MLEHLHRKHAIEAPSRVKVVHVGGHDLEALDPEKATAAANELGLRSRVGDGEHPAAWKVARNPDGQGAPTATQVEDPHAVLDPPAVVLAFAIWEIPRSRSPRRELALVATAAVIGLVVDSSYLRLGLLSYPQHGPLEPLAPVWIVALWVGFALTLNHSLAWMQGSRFFSAALGGISGAFSFWIGAKVWGAAEFVAPPALVLTVLALVWSIIIPALLAIARRLAACPCSPTMPPQREGAVATLRSGVHK